VCPHGDRLLTRLREPFQIYPNTKEANGKWLKSARDRLTPRMDLNVGRGEESRSREERQGPERGRRIEFTVAGKTCRRRKNMSTIHLFIHIMYTFHDENRD
jgi:hypothetical protein